MKYPCGDETTVSGLYQCQYPSCDIVLYLGKMIPLGETVMGTPQYKNFNFKNIYLFIYFCLHYIFIDVAFSSFSERGLLFGCPVGASLCSGFSFWGAQALGAQAYVVTQHGLQ